MNSTLPGLRATCFDSSGTRPAVPVIGPKPISLPCLSAHCTSTPSAGSLACRIEIVALLTQKKTLQVHKADPTPAVSKPLDQKSCLRVIVRLRFQVTVVRTTFMDGGPLSSQEHASSQ